MALSFKKLAIENAILVTPDLFRDDRGYFFESYKESVFKENGITAEFCQDNESKSTHGVLRGLHYQKTPHAQAKLVRCVEGKIFDVAVDIRKNSPTFGKWVGEILSDENKNMLYIPEGFAHGFLTLSETAIVTYKATKEYHQASDCGLLYNDPDLKINWGKDADFTVSEKDASQPRLCEIKAEDLF